MWDIFVFYNIQQELLQQEQKAILSPGNESPRTYLAPGYKPKYNLTVGIWVFGKADNKKLLLVYCVLFRTSCVILYIFGLHENKN